MTLLLVFAMQWNLLNLFLLGCKDWLQISYFCLDTPTRWNYTYLILQVVLKFKKGFKKLEEEDAQYLTYFGEDDGGKRKGGPPSFSDWENASVFFVFFKSYYDVTLKFSFWLRVSSNVYLHEVCSI